MVAFLQHPSRIAAKSSRTTSVGISLSERFVMVVEFVAIMKVTSNHLLVVIFVPDKNMNSCLDPELLGTGLRGCRVQGQACPV
jgi:hypothetical protein